MRDYKKTISDLRNFNANYEASKLTNDAANAIEELLAAAPRWISVEERLPEKHEAVLFYIPWNKSNMIGWYTEDGNINFVGYGKCYDFSLVKPSHWMTLPKPPKEELNEV